MEIVFSVLLAAVAAWALWNAVKSMPRALAGVAFAIVAVSALIQVLNLLSMLGGEYSVALSVITTLGLIGGYFMTRRTSLRT